jgi:hypothetical protein
MFCIRCKKLFRPTGRNCKRCPECRKLHASEGAKDRHKRTYERKGHNQLGPNNNAWKGGIASSVYRRIAYEHYGKVCQRCGAVAVLVHHKNEDRYDSSVENLEPLCKRCHQLHHDCVSHLPQFRQQKA